VLPKYISDRYPYKEKFYTDFYRVVDATKQALEDLRWQVAETADPAIYERAWQVDDPVIKQVLIFTEYREAFFIFGSRNSVINAYLRSGPDGAVDVQLRFLRVSTMPYKSFYKYRNDKLIEKLINQIEKNLKN